VLPASIDQQVQLHGTTYVQNEQTGGTEVDRQGFRKEKCREALVPIVQYQPHFISLPSTTYPKARSGQLTCGRMYSS
jgi:hypothetical protein